MQVRKPLAIIAVAVLMAASSSRVARAQTDNEEMQRYAYFLAYKPCPTCFDILRLLVSRGFKPAVAWQATWAYSNGWNIGYGHGCWRGQFLKANQPVPQAEWAQYEAFHQAERQKHALPEMKMLEAWGMFEVGYMDGQLLGVAEAPGCGRGPVRSPTTGDFLAHFRSLGMNPCDPFGDLPINPSGWGPFGGSLFGRC